MPHPLYVFAAYAIVWLALFTYLLVLAGSIRALRRDVAELRQALSASGEVDDVAR